MFLFFITRCELNRIVEDAVARQMDMLRESMDAQIDFVEGENVATQNDVDALTAEVDDLSAKVVAEDAALKQAVTGIEQEIADLQNAHPDLDLSGLEAKVGEARGAVDGLADSVDSVKALVPPATS